MLVSQQTVLLYQCTYSIWYELAEGSGLLDVGTRTGARSDVPICHQPVFPSVDLAGYANSAWVIVGDRGQMNDSQIHNLDRVVFSNSPLRCSECSLPAQSGFEFAARTASARLH